MADASTTQAMLYVHDDGRHAVASSPEAAIFTRGDPEWHRVGSVDLSALAAVPSTGPASPNVKAILRRAWSDLHHLQGLMEVVECTGDPDVSLKPREIVEPLRHFVEQAAEELIVAIDLLGDARKDGDTVPGTRGDAISTPATKPTASPAHPIFHDPARGDAAISAILDASVLFDALVRAGIDGNDDLAQLFNTLRDRIRFLLCIVQSAVGDDVDSGEAILRRYDGKHAPLIASEGTLYAHDDGRHAVVPSLEAATFTNNDPAWHRVGPVDLTALRGVSA